MSECNKLSYATCVPADTLDILAFQFGKDWGVGITLEHGLPALEVAERLRYAATSIATRYVQNTQHKDQQP